jgi:hypothetical protein
MPHPSENWIKFLLSRKEHSFDEIVAMCEMAQIGGVQNEDLLYFRSVLSEDEPVPFRAHDASHKPSTAYLRRHQIYEAWHRSASMKAAVDILANARIRPLVETFILSPMKPDQAVKSIKSNSGVTIDSKTYELFRHYFWNPSVMSAEEWGEFIQRRRVAHKEWLRLAVTSRGPEGVRLLLWKTGSGPIRHLSAAKIFTNLRNIAYLKAMELEHEPASKDHSIAFSNYVKSAKTAQEEVSASEAAMADVLDSFKAFQMTTTVEQVPSYLELTEGGKTGTVSDAGSFSAEEDQIGMDDY